MDREILNRYLDIQDAAGQDKTYRQLYRGYQIASTRFIALLNSLPKPQQEIVYEYIGTCADLHQRLMEIACEKMG